MWRHIVIHRHWIKVLGMVYGNGVKRGRQYLFPKRRCQTRTGPSQPAYLLSKVYFERFPKVSYDCGVCTYGRVGVTG